MVHRFIYVDMVRINLCFHTFQVFGILETIPNCVVPMLWQPYALYSCFYLCYSHVRSVARHGQVIAQEMRKKKSIIIILALPKQRVRFSSNSMF